MPCNKCNADFNILTWKLKCLECEDHYCSKCLTKVDGSSFCETCEILVKRPPIKTKLMELKSKDLQHYLNKHNISTRGIVEKQELVELLCKSTIPLKDKKHNRRFNYNLSGSVPNLAQKSQTYINNLKSNAQAAFNQRMHGHSAQSTPVRSPTNAQFGVPPTTNFNSTATNGPNPTSPQQESNNQPTTSHTSFHFNNDQIPHTGSATFGSSVETNVEQSSPQIPRKYPRLSDFKEASEMNELSVKQLKELLSLNRVDYKGCVEKAELLERANRLWSDANMRRDDVETTNNLDETCKICMDAPLDCVLLECGHMATCIECGKRLAECPICRQYVTRVVRTFKA